MSYLKVKGIIIKEVHTGEADKIVTVLSKTEGKISVYAKNAKRPKSRIAAGTQLLCFSDFVLYKGKEMYSVNSCDVVETFYEIRNDIVKLTYSAHMVDLLNDLVQENQSASKALQLFLNTLHILSKTEKSPELASRIFEIRLLSIMGYSPQVSGCTVCSRDDMDEVFFSYKKCGFLCKGCQAMNDAYAVNLSLGAVKAIRHIIYAKMNNLFSFNLSQDVLGELGRFTRRYLKDRLERDYTKLEFLKALDAQAIKNY